MSEDTRPRPRCVDCGDDGVPIDSEGLCTTCFMARGFRAMAERMRERERGDEPHREQVTGQRLAAIITAAAAPMPQAERMQLWLECYHLLGDRLDKDTHPELCAAINALPNPVPDDTRAAWWN